MSCRAYQRRQLALAKALKTLNYLMYRCLLPFEAEIEKDVSLKHLALGVVIHPQVTIGHNVVIYHMVSLAAECPVGSEHRIVIEDDVEIGTGAILIGNMYGGIRIGKGAKIGAGAVVAQNVAPGQIIVAMPGRPVPTRPQPSTVPEQQLKPTNSPDPTAIPIRPVQETSAA
ncbi:MAG: serine acetyltransferase [Capsulimonadaceae bacterium]